jgi:hypothetical protein
MTGTVDRLATALADRYAIERELGQGGMATVYLAHDLRHDRPVALKVLHPDLAHALGPEAAAEAAIKFRGSDDPTVGSEGTLAYLLTFDTGFRLIWLDSAGPITEEERGLMARVGQTDVAIVAYQGQYLAERQVAATLPLVKLFQPGLYLPAQMRLAAALGQDRSAAEIFDRWIFGRHLSPVGVLGTLERGRIAERLGQRDKAIESYRFVADVWRKADPELQPYVAEAREGLKRVVDENH